MRDAAIYNETLATGSYSIQIAGQNNATGLTLAGIYDATPARWRRTTTGRVRPS